MAFRHLFLPLCLLIGALPGFSQDFFEPDTVRHLMNYGIGFDFWTSSGTLAPYYMMANRDGRYAHGDGAQVWLLAERPLSTQKRFEYGFGAEGVAGWQDPVKYLQCVEDAADPAQKVLEPHEVNPSPLWLQKFWAGVKYRGVFIEAGLKPNERSLFNQELGVGDLTFSRNSRPMPRLTAGFIDFQDIPLTSGWVQIQGEISYGKMIDNKWLENHYNYYNSFITTGAWMQYSRCYFRTNPKQNFSVTVGMQHATQFGGTYSLYKQGELRRETKNKVSLKTFVNAFFPWGSQGTSNMTGDAAFYDGNHLGTWDLRLRYRLPDDDEITAYMQSPWEDGSGIGKLNGFDGVWGLEYKSSEPDALVAGIVLEYIDFTNQSGPMHWAPGDFPGTEVSGEATGGDDYYNNFMYNGWAHFGQAIGTPFAVAPVYNFDGYMRFLHNRVRGFQLGSKGYLLPSLDWRFLFSFRTSKGTPLVPALERTSDTSMMLEGGWQPPGLGGTRIGVILAWDAGRLLGKNFGAFFSVSYVGPFK